MCGILGTFDSGRISNSLVLESLNSIVHRGPDDKGFYEDKFVKLSMCRLSIVDIVSGQQPVQSQSESVVVVFNGEIYNFKDLRSQLEKRGYRFKSLGDSEVIANLYQEFGHSFVTKLNGMFAIALWDKSLHKLYLYRDRLGKKPLWYSNTVHGFCFSSEIKGLLKLGVDRTVNFETISECLIYGYSKAPKSPFVDIEQVEPAHYICFDGSIVRSFRYWSLDEVNTSRFTKEEAKHELKRLLRSSVELRLNSERPVGVFLSGGIDSTLITAISREISKGEVRTFTAVFSEENYDERLFAEQVSKELGTKHEVYEIIPEPEVILSEIAGICDQPFADSSIIPLYLLSKRVREQAVVVLGGDGGDEVFGGYDRYQAILKTRLIRSLQLSRLFSNEFQGRFGERTQRVIEMLRYDALSSRYDSLLRNIHPGIFEKLTSHKTNIYQSELEEIWPKDPGLLLRKMQLSDIYSYLPNDLMYKADMASMAASIELRSPFLDYRIVEFGVSLPIGLKLARGTGKILLRDIAADYVSNSIVKRPKKGFGVPIGEWIRGPLRELSEELLIGGRTRERGWIDIPYARQLFRDHIRGRSHERVLWPLLTLELWARSWLDS